MMAPPDTADMPPSLGFFGMGDYTGSFALSWRKKYPNAKIHYYDAKPHENNNEIKACYHASFEKLLNSNPQVLFLGLSYLVADTLAHLVAAREMMLSLKNFPKLIICLDYVPLEEAFSDEDVGLAGTMFHRNIVNCGSPIVWHVQRPGKDNYAETFARTWLNRLCMAGECPIVLKSPPQLNLAKLLIGMDHYLDHVAAHLKVSFLDLAKALVQQFSPPNKCLITEDELNRFVAHTGPRISDGGGGMSMMEVGKNAMHAGDKGNTRIDLHRRFAAELAVWGPGTGTNERPERTSEKCFYSAFEIVGGDYARDMLAHSIEALAMAVTRRCALDPTLDRPRIERLVDVGLARLYENWSPSHLVMAERITYGDEPQVFPKSANGKPNAARLLFATNRDEFLKLCLPFPELAKTADHLDEAWMVRFKPKPGGADRFSGRPHREVTGLRVLTIEPATIAGLNAATSQGEQFQILTNHHADNNRIGSIKRQLGLTAGNNDETCCRLVRFLDWVFTVYEGEQVGLRSVLYVPCHRESSIPMALFFGSSIDLGSPVSTAVANLARNSFGLMLERESARSHQRLAHAALMARNMSHNIGSHVLASPVIAEAGKEKLSPLHAYLQTRLDFIARSMGEISAPPQPALLNSGLFANLMTQELLMENLVKDNGVGAATIMLDDLGEHLVQIAGGPVGAHALYIIAENVLRNAAKYGKNPTQPGAGLHLEITAKDCEASAPSGKAPAVCLTFSDSFLCSKKGFKTINTHRNQTATTPEGWLREGGHGIREIVVCAEFLSGGLRFEDGKALKVAWTQESGQQGFGRLSYSVLLPKPLLCGLVGAPAGTALPLGFTSFQSLEDLAKSPAHFGVLWQMDSPENAPELLGEVSAHHRALPFRLLLVTVPEHQAAWKSAIQDCHSLPARRLHVIDATDLGNFPQAAVDGSEWLAKLAGAWLQAWKGFDRLSLEIGFEREPEHHAFTRWQTACANGNENIIKALGVGVDVRRPTRNAPAQTPANETCRITFDNHGKCFGREPQDAPADCNEKTPDSIDHIFAGSSHLQLSQFLENPPSEPLALVFYLLSLVESALLRVAVLDERVAQACIASQGPNWDRGVLKNFHVAGVFPFFAWSNAEGIHPLVPVESLPGGQRDLGCLSLQNLQHTCLNHQSAMTTKVCTEKSDEPMPLCNVDVLVFHEGLFDKFPEAAQLLAGTLCVPKLVRTSGRGSRSRHKLSSIPFVEFSHIKACLYPSLDKPSLGTALIGARSPSSP